MTTFAAALAVERPDVYIAMGNAGDLVAEDDDSGTGDGIDLNAVGHCTRH